MGDFTVAPVSSATIDSAVEIKSKYRLSIWDSLIVASALGAGCETLYTEDLQDGQIFERTLKSVNPFRAA
jgi:predicted nucleic acid-binding protein